MSGLKGFNKALKSNDAKHPPKWLQIACKWVQSIGECGPREDVWLSSHEHAPQMCPPAATQQNAKSSLLQTLPREGMLVPASFPGCFYRHSTWQQPTPQSAPWAGSGAGGHCMQIAFCPPGVPLWSQLYHITFFNLKSEHTKIVMNNYNNSNHLKGLKSYFQLFYFLDSFNTATRTE